MIRMNDSLAERSARERARALLDDGTFRELIGPFEEMESPHLAAQGIVPQCDDGVVVARGAIDGVSAVVVAIEGAFQGGGIGEVSGAKIAGALEMAVCDNEAGFPTRAVVVLDSGGVRLQEANYGLLAISEIQSAVVALRGHTPVVGVIPGKVGCFGGMSMTAMLFSTLIITPEGRMTLNGPEVIEQEAGVAEFDSKDRPLIWRTTGGIQRQATGFADLLCEDDAGEIREAVRAVYRSASPETREGGHDAILSEDGVQEPEFRSSRLDRLRARFAAIDPMRVPSPEELGGLWRDELSSVDGADGGLGKPDAPGGLIAPEAIVPIVEVPDSRGGTWFRLLTGRSCIETDGPASVLCADAPLDGETARFLAVVPDPRARFPRARGGEVGLEEGLALARRIREAMDEDLNAPRRRPIVAIVDVPSQAYGYREELLGIFLSCAAAVDAYASARQAGHPVAALLVGPAISGAFLAHGYQASRLIALDDPGVLVHAMSKQSAARITRRSVEELEAASASVPAIAYDIRSYSTLGTLDELLPGIRAEAPEADDLKRVRQSLVRAVRDARAMPFDLRVRLSSEAAKRSRAASIEVRRRLAEQWNAAEAGR